MYQNIIVLMIPILFLIDQVKSQHVKQKYATTEMDQKVILNENGTWEYIQENKQTYEPLAKLVLRLRM